MGGGTSPISIAGATNKARTYLNETPMGGVVKGVAA
jgi:hypothetical protein